MTEKKNIYETINAVMGEIGAIGKNKKNQQQNFNYRGIDDVMNALAPAFIKHKLFVVPEVLDQVREERQTVRGGNLIYSVCRMRYIFYAEDGSHIDAVVVGEGMDSGDKATNKAMSIAFKYACFQVFCIPTEEMKDPDAESHEVKPNNSSQAQSRTQAAGNHRNSRQSAPPPQNPVQRVNDQQLNDMMRECDRTGIHWRTICEIYKVEKLSDMDQSQYSACMKRFAATPAKAKPNPQPNVPEDDSGLPWNTPG